MRGSVNIFRILVILVFVYTASTPNPRPDPGPPMSMEELERCLADSLMYQRTRGARQLIGLSEEYRPLMISALHSRYEDVRLAAVEALALIGDAESASLLCEYLQEVGDNRELAILTAEALSRAGAQCAIPIIREVLKKNKDKYVQEYLNRAINRIETPGRFRPLIETRFGLVTTNFLIDDVKAISCEFYDEAYNKHRPYYVDENEWTHVLTLVRRAEVGLAGGYAIRQFLVIQLKNGREARLVEDNGAFFCMNDSYFFHRYNEHICIKSEELSRYLHGHASRD